jgi:hypothetical protein
MRWRGSYRQFLSFIPLGSDERREYGENKAGTAPTKARDVGNFANDVQNSELTTTLPCRADADLSPSRQGLGREGLGSARGVHM